MMNKSTVDPNGNYADYLAGTVESNKASFTEAELKTKELVPQKKYKEDPNGAGNGVVRIGVAPLALIHVMEAARGAVRRLHAVFVHHAVTRCKIAAAFARKLFFCFLQFLYGVFGVLCYTESGKNP